MDRSREPMAPSGTAVVRGAGASRRLRLPLLEGIPGLAHAFTVAGSDPDVVLSSVAGRLLPLWTLRQVHGRHVVSIDGDGPEPWRNERPQGDALLTTRRGHAVAVHV